MATNSKAKKEHNKKVAKRNQKIQDAKTRQNKMMQAYFNQIKEMQEEAKKTSELTDVDLDIIEESKKQIQE